MHPSIKILDQEKMEDHYRILVENSTDIHLYLQLPGFHFRYNFYFNNNKIDKLEIDSVEGYFQNIKKMDENWGKFKSWVEQTHPLLQDTLKYPYSIVTHELLKEYSQNGK